MSTKEISAAAQALGRRGGLKSLGAKTPAELSAFGKAAAEKRWAAFGRGKQSGEPTDFNVCTAGGFHGPETTAICRCAYADPIQETKTEPPKPKRALPKAGTMAAAVLSALESLSAAGLAPLASSRIALHAALGEVATQNALSSLRSAGHVVSEPKPGSRKEKLWRLA